MSNNGIPLYDSACTFQDTCSSAWAVCKPFESVSIFLFPLQYSNFKGRVQTKNVVFYSHHVWYQDHNFPFFVHPFLILLPFQYFHGDKLDFQPARRNDLPLSHPVADKVHRSPKKESSGGQNLQINYQKITNKSPKLPK